jgi:hypothetical protein
MGQFNLSYGKVFGGAGTFLPKKVPANRLPDKKQTHFGSEMGLFWLHIWKLFAENAILRFCGDITSRSRRGD